MVAQTYTDGCAPGSCRMAKHESARATGLHDRRNDTVALDEVDRVVY
jgi:hypothetical protein